jgi:hypothetical protein
MVVQAEAVIALQTHLAIPLDGEGNLLVLDRHGTGKAQHLGRLFPMEHVASVLLSPLLPGPGRGRAWAGHVPSRLGLGQAAESIT